MNTVFGGAAQVCRSLRDRFKAAFGSGSLRTAMRSTSRSRSDSEHTLETSHPKLRIAQARNVGSDWVDELLIWVGPSNIVWPDDAVKQKLQQLVPEYLSTTLQK